MFGGWRHRRHGAALPWQVTLINYGQQWRTRLIYLSEDVLLI